MTLETLSAIRSHGGTQMQYRHVSASTKTPMELSVFVPDHESGAKLPVIWFLSGLTCTPLNVTEKGEFREACTRHGFIFIAPDTSPRGDDVPDDPEAARDFGLAAGFYVNATQAPFSEHYHMRDYIEIELPEVIGRNLPYADMSRQSIMGHSMGGHGALTVGLRNPERFKAVSAFAPINSPINCPWGQKAMAGYLGDDQSQWEDYDACTLIKNGARLPDILVDQGAADEYIETELKPDLLREACETAGQPLTLRIHDGYNHGYYFVSSFMKDHIDWHAERLLRGISLS